MRRTVMRACGLVAALAAVAGFGVLPQAKALGPIPGVIDLAVAVESLPGTVAPAGSGVIYRVTARNAGITPLLLGGAEVTDTVAEGFSFDTTDPRWPASCDVDGRTATCSVPGTSLAPGQRVVLDLPAVTSTTVGDYTNQATIASTDITEPLEHQDNNTASTSTAVRSTPEAGNSYAYIPPGGSLSFSGATGSTVLNVPESCPGVFARVRDDDSFVGAQVGDKTAGIGPEIVFDEDEPDYQCDDPTDPIVVLHQPSDQPACRGLHPGCAPLAYFDPNQEPAMTGPERLARCDGAGGGDQPGDGQAFVDGQYQVCEDSRYKNGNQIVFRILMKSVDPNLPRLY